MSTPRHKKAMLTLGIVFLILFVMWLGMAYDLVPDLIRDEYRGEGPAFLRGVISGQDSHPVEFYLGLWHRGARWVTMALICLGGIAVGLVHFSASIGRRFAPLLSELAKVPGNPRVILRCAVWYALVVGIGEGLLMLALGALGWDTWSLRLRTVTPEILGTSVAVDLVLFLYAGLVLIAVGRLFPKISTTIPAVLVFTALGAGDWLAVALTDRLHDLTIALLALGIAVAFSRTFIKRHTAIIRFWDKSLRWILMTVLILAIPVYGQKFLTEHIAYGNLPVAPPESPNVVVVVVDALRADHLSVYGYDRPTSPAIDALAEEGVLFENAIAPSSWTLPSHASLLTGRLPHEHRAEWCQPLDDQLPTIGEMLQRVGYRTGGFSANTLFFSRRFGLDRGFIRFEDVLYSIRDRLARTQFGRSADRLIDSLPFNVETIYKPKSAADINRSLLAWIDRDPQRPFFAVLNYFDVHGPYLAPQPYRERFTKADSTFGDIRRIAWRWKQNVSEAQLQYIVDTYDGAISYVDDQIAHLVSELDHRDLTQRTLLIITSDHGSMFREHGVIGHQTDLWDSELHIPLIVRWPSHIPAGRRLVEPVAGNTALPATVLELAGVDGRLSPEQGLAAYWTRDSVRPEAPAFPISQLAAHPRRKYSVKSIVTPSWHYVERVPGSARLYNRSRDPKELADVAETPGGQRVVEEMRAAVLARVPEGALESLCQQD